MSYRDGKAEVYVANTDGTGGLVNISNDSASDYYPSLSANGSTVAWHSTRDGDPEVYVAKTNGTGLANISNDSGTDASPSLQGN
jgi:TolB protein